MTTTTYKTLTPETLNKIKSDLLAGLAVGVPTETVYGLAVNGLSEKAVSDLYELKGRPEVKPLSLMVPSSEKLSDYAVDIPDIAYFLAQRFWPGPLTIILKANTEKVPEVVRAGGSTLGFRCPKHEDTLKLLNSIDFPLAVPSANPSGQPSAVTAQQVSDYFDGKIPSVIDGGECVLSFESTVLSLSQTPYKILRRASLSPEELDNAYFDYANITGLTGPSGSGKSYIAGKIIDEREILYIDCDKVYHNLLDCDEDFNRLLINSFPGIADDENPNRISRKKLGKIVFSSDEELDRLNRITHPEITKEVKRLIADYVKNGGRDVLLDAPTLIESGVVDWCQNVTVVLADRETRIQRIMKRDNITKEDALRRINSQPDDSFYTSRATNVIINN